MHRDSQLKLVTHVDEQVSKVQTNGLDISLNELADMRENLELDITPDFQRLFRWSEAQQSRFIESLLLDLPVPPIFVLEQDDGKWILIDGLQRISSYLHFRGQLEFISPVPDGSIHKGEKLRLDDCDIVHDLNGNTFDSLPLTLQLKLKRAFIRVEVIRRGSDARFKYHMFKRLNTGGEKLTDQQVRNATIRLLDPKFNDFIVELSKTNAFMECTEILTDGARLGAYDEELVLRFFALKNDAANFRHDIGDFLTDYMEKISDPQLGVEFDYGLERRTFENTFQLFARTLGDLSFGNVSKKSSKLTRGFSTLHYEALSIGIQPLLCLIDSSDDEQVSKLKEALLALKKDSAFITMVTGGGKNSSGLLKQRISYVTEFLKPRL